MLIYQNYTINELIKYQFFVGNLREEAYKTQFNIGIYTYIKQSRKIMNVEKSSEKTNQAQLCKSCKNFWGSQAAEGLCSKCFGLKNKAENVSIKKNSEQIKKVTTEPVKQVIPAKGLQQNKSKCFDCSKKVGLLGVECKCGYVFCNNHRLPEDHKCTINYEQQGKQKLKKQIIVMPKRKISEF